MVSKQEVVSALSKLAGLEEQDNYLTERLDVTLKCIEDEAITLRKLTSEYRGMTYRGRREHPQMLQDLITTTGMITGLKFDLTLYNEAYERVVKDRAFAKEMQKKATERKL